MARYVEDESGFSTQVLLGKNATKGRLQELLNTRKPAVVFTASHGLGAPDCSLEVQKKVNGAPCCQRTGYELQDADWLFTADDVPENEPFLEGANVFQFACFGYGTPAESDFSHWLPQINKLNASADFIAAVPKRLLAHPRGPSR